MENILKFMLITIIFLSIVSSILVFTVKPVVVSEFNLTGEKTPTISFTNITSNVAWMKVPAVDNEGNGVTTKLLVEAMPGKGRVMVDINQLLFWIDTQYSIRIAQRVAQNVTGIDISNIDLIYAIETNASIIGGPSAGAALTVATIAALENKTINKDVMITGTINHDGTIGPVGEIVAKAKAAKDVGTTVFLVPVGQSVQTYYRPVRYCEQIGPIKYCSTEYKTEKVNVSESAGIEVKEVSNIQEALKYFLG